MAANEKAGKNNDKPTPTPTPSASGQEGGASPSALPEGYLSSSSDAVGFFDGDLQKPIHFVPMHVILADSQIEKNKPSALIFGRLIDPCAAIRDGAAEGEYSKRPLIETKRGDVVGIWFSAGMRDLANYSGCKVFMVQDPESNWKKIKGKPSKMKTYTIGKNPDRPDAKLVPREDRRNESAGVNAPPFAGRKLAGASAAGVDNGDAGGDDDIPF